MARVDYTARLLGPYYLERGRPNELVLGMYRDGALVAPSAGTVSVFDASGTARVDAAAVTVTDSQATYTVLSAVTSSLALESGWRVEWSLSMPDTFVHVVRADAALARCRLHPVITDADLLARHSDLTALRPSSMASYQGYVDEAWREIVARLEAAGRRPYLVLSPEALRPVHLNGTLAIIFRDFGGTGAEDNKWSRLAEHYETAYQAAWGSVSLVYDETDSGSASGVRRAGMQPSVWTNGRTYGTALTVGVR